jgi:Uri superfamily endonuclease
MRTERSSATNETTGPWTTYQLVIRVGNDLCLRVGRFGTWRFPAGVYIYTGSASRNFEARVARHLRRDKTLRWHIDYLLAAPGVEIEAVVRSTETECLLNRNTPGQTLIPGFGASDCVQGCGSHLKYQGLDTSRTRSKG